MTKQEIEEGDEWPEDIDKVDTLAEQYADKNRLSKYIMRPRYDLYGRAAPLKRNEEMIKIIQM